ncbi:MAG: thiamine phosphate synthase [Haloferacaceae archaeon]
MDYEVYLVTEAGLADGRTTTDVVRDAVAGGVDVVQLREKMTSARARYDLGRNLRALTREAGVALVVNDRVDIARAIEADGVHLGDDDLPVEVAREQLGEDAVVGRSVSTVEGAEAAEAAGADYLGVGAVYRTATKDTEPRQSAIGLDRVRAIRAAVDVPFVGIGGVDAGNATDVVAAGADGVAVVSAIMAADDPTAATQELGDAVERGRERRERGSER